MKKGKKKSEKKVRVKKEKEVKEQAMPLSADDSEEDLNEFGGMPIRSLKRNLGCG